MSTSSPTSGQAPTPQPAIGGGQDRHVVQMIAHASLDSVEETMRLNNAMYVFILIADLEHHDPDDRWIRTI